MEAMFKELKKDMTIMCHQTGNINKELDIIKKIEILTLIPTQFLGHKHPLWKPSVQPERPELNPGSATY